MQIGKGSLNQLPEIIKTLDPIKSFLIVTDKQMVEFGYVKKLQDILSKAGLVLQERRGRVKWCKLDPEAMHAAFVWIQTFGQLDPINLDTFEEFLEKEKLLNNSESI